VAVAAVALRRRCSSNIREVLVPFDELHEEDLDSTIARPLAVPPAAAAVVPVVAEVAAPAAAEVPWWEQSPAVESTTETATATPASLAPNTTSSSVSFLGRNTVGAAVAAGVLAGVLGSLATTLVDPFLDERGETVAFVAFIGVLLGGFLRSMQSFLARNWSSAFRQFALGAVVGGGAYCKLLRVKSTCIGSSGTCTASIRLSSWRLARMALGMCVGSMEVATMLCMYSICSSIGIIFIPPPKSQRETQ
jgi:hypothetical protein